MNDEKKLVYYFNRFSQSLQVVVFNRTGNYFHDNDKNPVSHIYLCPLCLTNKIDISQGYLHYDEEFTLDHFPPFSVGGKTTTLVCRPCNTTSGSAFENSLKEWLQFQSFKERVPDSRIPVRLELENTKGIYKGNLIQDVEVGSYRWELPDYPFVKEWFDKLSNGGELKQTISVKEPEIKSVYKSILKSAYLYCFSTWGYDFVYSFTASKIREIIFNNTEHILSNYVFFSIYRKNIHRMDYAIYISQETFRPF